MTERLQRFDEEQGGETFINLHAKTGAPLVRASKDFRQVRASGVSASTVEQSIEANEIGTLDE